MTKVDVVSPMAVGSEAVAAVRLPAVDNTARATIMNDAAQETK